MTDAPTCPDCGRALESQYGGGWYCPEDTQDPLSTTQTHVLWILKTAGPMERDAVSERLRAIFGHDFSGVIRPMVDDLEDRGLVEGDGPANKMDPYYSVSREVSAALEGDGDAQ